jgi:hypothetical protein
MTPLSVFKDYIERQNVSVAPLSFGSLDAVPADCATLIIVAPQFDIEEREAMILGRYWKEKGRLLLLLDPRVKTPRLTSLLKQAGVTPLDNRVLRTVRLPFATGILRDVTAEFLLGNAITKRMAGINILLPGATQSLSFDAGQSQAAGVQIWPLIRASDEFWGETDHETDEKKGVRYEEGKDAGQPLYVALAAARGGVKDERVEVESAKLVAVGSCEFALDAALNQQGLDFLLSAMNWLLDRGQFTGVMPKTVKHFFLNLTDAQLGSTPLYDGRHPRNCSPCRPGRLVAEARMSGLKTILVWLAIAAIVFLAIYEPLTRSTREHVAAARKGLVLTSIRRRCVRSGFPPESTNLKSNDLAMAGSLARNQRTGRILV